MTSQAYCDSREDVWTRTRSLMVVAVFFVGLGVCHLAGSSQPPGSASRLAPDRSRVAGMSPELRGRLAASPMAFFRFVNQAWTREVCATFRAEARTLPTATLHGDAHVEQYAMTATARGLDDFDDSDRGPAVIDIVRFLGSLELAAAQRGWTESLSATIDAFLAGYRRALHDPSYMPPDPAVVKRLRGARVKTQEEFLSWTDSLMQPLAEHERANMHVTWAKVVAFASKDSPEFTPAFMTLKNVGWLRIGIGSALTRQLLIRIEGPSPGTDDDLVLEGKQVFPFQSSCLNAPRSSEGLRVVEGVRQIARLQPPLLVALPGIDDSRPYGRDWWVRTWDRTYREVEIADLDSPEELREVAHDAGAQLGSTNLTGQSGTSADQSRLVELKGIVRLEPRIRKVAHDLTADLLQAWEQFRVSR
jgi:uncharacterized protein (DUF2252 family)